MKYIISFWQVSRLKVILKDFYFPLMALATVAIGVVNINVILGYFVNLFILAYAFVINDYEDADDDAKDPKKVMRNPISAGRISKKEGFLLVAITGWVTVGLSFVTLNWISVIIALSGVLVGHLYSWKVIRFKSIPVLDILSHIYALAIVQVLYFISLPDAKVSLGSWLIMIGVGIFSAGGCFYNQYRDYQVDRDTNIKNTASLLPKKIVGILAVVFYVLGVVLCTIGVAERIFEF